MSAGTPECEVEAGWQTSDSVPPSDTAGLKICSALMIRQASALSSATTKEKVEPGPLGGPNR
jgi:hypothetical protein